MLSLLMKLLGGLGLILISKGIFEKNEKRQDWIFALGGFFLLLYSIYLKDPIFIPLQIVFISASFYELHKLKTKK